MTDPRPPFDPTHRPGRAPLGGLTRRHGLGAALALTLAGPRAWAATSSGHEEIKWEALVPPDWDPMKRFRLLNLALLNDGDAKTQKLMNEMRGIWDSAPTVAALDGRAVRLPGYVVPLDEVKGQLKEFLLVPYFGACIHTPPPPANQIVHVRLDQPVSGYKTMDTVWAMGTLRTVRRDSGESGLGVSGYQLADAKVERYKGPPGTGR